MAHAVIHGCIMCIRDVALLAWLLVDASGMRTASAQRPALQVKDYQVLDSNSNDITSQEGTGDNVQQPPRPPGMHITTGHKNYDYDNRTYQLLPSRPYNIDPIEHQQAMI
jgi:hypothetical protein